MASIEMNLNAWPVREVRSILLTDRTTRKNIIFATDSYADKGPEYGAKNHITAQALQVLDICSRVLKNSEEQQIRTRKKAEVFTPAWMCCMMNNHADTVWFGKEDVFGHLEGTEWVPSTEPVQFPKRKKWQSYVDARRLEITCGEAPYLTSRYDMGTGEMIQIAQRIGILDRKLRIVSENAQDEVEWLKWAIRSLQAVYGYEYQGDNLLIARVNLLLTFAECLQEHLQRDATRKELREAARIISWNIWQMDGLKGTIPMGTLYEQNHQMSLFEMEHAEMDRQDDATDGIPCRIYNWRSKKKSLEFNAFQGGKSGTMKFDFIIGNPPYQQESVGANANDTPLYHYYFDAATSIADKVELITPARFLFDAGGTPKEWNEKMLKDDHLKVGFYEQDSSKVFSGTSITGGVVVIYRDANRVFGAIDVFSPFEELNSIVRKVGNKTDHDFSEIVSNRGLYKYSDLAYKEEPDEMKKTADRRIAPSCFERMPRLFTDSKPADGHEYVRVYGNVGNDRVYKWFRRDYVNAVDNIDKYKVFISKADGAAGTIGKPIPARVSGKPVVIEPGVVGTETYIAIGSSSSQNEVDAICKYIKTRFLRTLLGVLKVTQNNAKPTWRKIPLQDFTQSSDIDWSAPIKAIDQQLYRKYGLSKEEITFIETHVKEMI